MLVAAKGLCSGSIDSILAIGSVSFDRVSLSTDQGAITTPLDPDSAQSLIRDAVACLQMVMLPLLCAIVVVLWRS
jgi:hypothetical protein